MATLQPIHEPKMQTLCELEVPSQPGNELVAARAVLQVLKPYDLQQETQERMLTAIAEATMNAMEHGNLFCAEDPVLIEVQMSATHVVVRVKDHGNIEKIEAAEPPDIEAKLAGRQSPRGWGMFLIRHMADEIVSYMEGDRHITKLVWKCESRQFDEGYGKEPE